ncbi:MAG: complex I subunit 5 family protein [Erythrobacter sp.]
MNALAPMVIGDIWPFAVLVWPLLIGLVAALPGGARWALRLLPLAPLPALGFALAGAPGAVLLPDLILGTSLEAGRGGALFIAMTAVVWAVAGLHVALTFERGARNGVFAGFWCLTLAGNLGVFLAQDIASFYVAFAAVSLAAWFLVVHDRTPEALYAGRIYIILAIIGEASLLAGLLIGAQAADNFAIAEVRGALAGAPLGSLAAGLLVAGFGIKAGMVPLHIWLPLAHPAAPVPGSAVLSGAIVKAGLIGVLAFIPQGGFPPLEDTVLALGLIGAFGAALWGLTQNNPKAVLAYSTISQMGVMLALSMTAAASMVPFYALHHGLAKGALFLLVGVFLTAGSARQRGLVLVAMGAIGLSVAGLPFTGGAIVKAAAKAEAPEWLALAVSASGITTSAVLGWLLVSLGAKPSKPKGSTRLWPILLAGPIALGLAAWALPHALGPMLRAPDWTYFTKASAFGEAGLPVLAGATLAWLLARRPLPPAPTGDLIAMLPTINRPRFAGIAAKWRSAARAIRWGWLITSRRAAIAARGGEAILLRWPLAGALLTATTLLLAWRLAAA